MEIMRKLIKKTMNLIHLPDDDVTSKIIQDIMSFGKLPVSNGKFYWNDVVQLFRLFMGLKNNQLEYEDFTDYNRAIQYTIEELERLVTPEEELEHLVTPENVVSMDRTLPTLDSEIKTLQEAQERLIQTKDFSIPLLCPRRLPLCPCHLPLKRIQ